MRYLGIDTGGTFTDFVYLDGERLDGERLITHKILSTPAAPEQAIRQGIQALGLEVPGLSMTHGSTVATNAVLEGKGARTAYLTNRGLADALTIGRQARQALYNLLPGFPPIPVPRALCLESGGRLGADGAVIEPLEEWDLAALQAALARLDIEAVAINLLFAYRDDRFERAIEAVIPPHLFVSRSSQVLPEQREYERGIATWLNSYVGPLMQRYLSRLAQDLSGAQLKVMQSHGGTIDAHQAGRHGVQLLLSGPAGGLSGAHFVAQAVGLDRLLTLDMGGTSTDVALIDGKPRLTAEGAIAGYPVAIPMVDLHTIGAGGGSIAQIDAGGLLQVGPESAGADPGPACYGRGGRLPTVTDAHLVLGRLPNDGVLSGGLTLSSHAAAQAVGGLSQALGTELAAAASGVIRIVNEHMAQALRVISVQRGIDPRTYTLTSFGGAGGLHVCDLAEALGMRHAMVPIHAGVLSALGMLVAPQGRQRSQGINRRLEDVAPGEIRQVFARLENAAHGQLREEGVAVAEVDYRLDLRYFGQSATLSLPWFKDMQIADAFHAYHRRQFGYALAMPIELVTLRVGLYAKVTSLALPPLAARLSGVPIGYTPVHGFAQPVAVYRREALAPEQVLSGPCLITERLATTWVNPGWRCRVHPTGSLLLDRL